MFIEESHSKFFDCMKTYRPINIAGCALTIIDPLTRSFSHCPMVGVRDEEICFRYYFDIFTWLCCFSLPRRKRLFQLK